MNGLHDIIGDFKILNNIEELTPPSHDIGSLVHEVILFILYSE